MALKKKICMGLLIIIAVGVTMAFTVLADEGRTTFRLIVQETETEMDTKTESETKTETTETVQTDAKTDNKKSTAVKTGDIMEMRSMLIFGTIFVLSGTGFIYGAVRTDRKKEER